MSDRDSILDKLNDVHEFPGPYRFKVIGPNNDDFASRIIQSVLNASGPSANPDVETRESSKGAHLSLTVTIQAESAEHVLEVYDVLQTIDDVRFIL